MFEWLRGLFGGAAKRPDSPEPEQEPEEEEVDPSPPAEDLQDQAVRADWLCERGDPRGVLINAELAHHPELHRLVVTHLPAVLGPLLPLVEVLEVRFGAATEVRLRRLPTAEERASEAWKALERIEAIEEVRRRLDDPRGVRCALTSRVPRRFVPYQLVRAGLDRQLWLVYDTVREEPVVLGLPDPDQVIGRDETGLVRERVIGGEIYPLDLEVLGPQPWSDAVAAVVGDADPAQWVLVDGVPRSLGPSRSWNRPRCSGRGWAGMQSRGGRAIRDEDGYAGDGQRFLVLDGMGGHAPGAVPQVARALTAFAATRGLEAGLIAAHAPFEAAGNRAAMVAAERSPDGRGCFFVWWCGDARAYRVGPDGLELLTRDHTLVNRLVDEGRRTPAEADRDRYRNVLLRSFGSPEEGASADLGDRLEVSLAPGERLLLCTDGLWRALSERAIFACLRDRTVHDGVEAVVRRANAVASDNLAVLLIEESGA